MSFRLPERIPLTFWRRASQVLFLAVFLFLFRKTDYQGSDQIPYAVNIFFRWDPLVAAAAMLAGRAFIALLLPALVVAGLTVVLGRFFCGWVCPLGTLADASDWIVSPRQKGPQGPRRTWKYYLLVLVLVSAAFGLPLVGFFDPFSILVRGLALSADPALNRAVSFPFDYIYAHAPSWVTDVTEAVFSFLRDKLLPYQQKHFTLALSSLAILVGALALGRLERRFWCRNLCPLGALLGLCARPSLLRWQPGKACDRECMSCRDICRMGAIDEEGLISPDACNLCLDCIEDCPKNIVTFRFKRPKARPAPVGLSRRGFVGTVAAGVLLPSVFRISAKNKNPDPFLIRPPGALVEDEFEARCVRCGECMKVCINNALQPAFLEAGPEGMFSPVVVARVGYCEYNCTLCGQVCPTGAIREISVDEKHEVVIGRAWFDRNRCLPWAKATTCLVCEEMCPVPDKAIKMREETAVDAEGNEVLIKRPYLEDGLCTGCGTCENKCPLPGQAAVRVTREGESRDPESVAPPG